MRPDRPSGAPTPSAYPTRLTRISAVGSKDLFLRGSVHQLDELLLVVDLAGAKLGVPVSVAAAVHFNEANDENVWACNPRNSPIYTLNDLHMSVPAYAVWEWLVRAPLWPTWYLNSRQVLILDGPYRDRLGAGSRFSWRTSNTLWTTVETAVERCEPTAKLGWGGEAMGSHGYHSWLLVPEGEGCHVVTEECQAGLLPALGHRVLRRGLLKQHQRWLEGLERMAKQGPPP